MDGYQKFFLKAKLNSGREDAHRSDSSLHRQDASGDDAEELVLAELRAREAQASQQKSASRVSQRELSPEARLKLAIEKKAMEKKSPQRRGQRGSTEGQALSTARRSTNRTRPKFPAVLSAAVLIAGSAGVATTQFYPEAIADLEQLQSQAHASQWGQSLSRLESIVGGIQIGVFGQAQAADVKSGAAAAGADAEAKASASANSAASSTTTSADSAQSGSDQASKKKLDVRQWTEEELSFFEKLNERKEALDRREAELAKLEEELQRQKGELDKKIKKLEAMRAEISETLKERVVQDQEKVAKLVDVYSNMKPSQAAKVIENLNEDLAVAVLDRMKKKNAADILNMMSSEKAKALSEMLTGYRAVGSAEREAERRPATSE
jgi:flagellar motility protein MotE (MotC chaperone)